MGKQKMNSKAASKIQSHSDNTGKIMTEEIKKLSDEYLTISLSKEGQKVMRENRKRILKERRNKEGIFSLEEDEAWGNQK